MLRIPRRGLEFPLHDPEHGSDVGRPRIATRGSMRTHANRPQQAQRVLLTFAAAAAILAGSALRAARPRMSGPLRLVDCAGRRQLQCGRLLSVQLAQFPEASVGTSSAGEAIHQLATSGPAWRRTPSKALATRPAAVRSWGPDRSARRGAGSSLPTRCSRICSRNPLRGARDEGEQAGTALGHRSC
jgi:hypothetical protein